MDLPGGRFLGLAYGELWGGGKINTDSQGYKSVNVGDVLELHLDADTGSLTFYRNGAQFGPGFAAGDATARVQPPVVLAVGLMCPGQAVTLVCLMPL